MLSAKETKIILEIFFNECYDFWREEGEDDVTAFRLAIEDVRSIKHHPFEVNGKELDVLVKRQFIVDAEIELELK
jgi:hypothetical protein